MRIAIDGPAGSGKSSVCKILAERYGLTYVDTGAMYRAAAWFSEKFGGDGLSGRLEKVDFIFSENGRKLSLSANGETWDVTEAIRTPEISCAVSGVAANPLVRSVLAKKQKTYAAQGGVIMEGRDITTVVMPEAEIKIYLTAAAEERANRRFAELDGKGGLSYDEVLASIKRRDEADSSRSCSPLKKADDAVFIDTTGLTLEQTANLIGKMIETESGGK